MFPGATTAHWELRQSYLHLTGTKLRRERWPTLHPGLHWLYSWREEGGPLTSPHLTSDLRSCIAQHWLCYLGISVSRKENNTVLRTTISSIKLLMIQLGPANCKPLCFSRLLDIFLSAAAINWEIDASLMGACRLQSRQQWLSAVWSWASSDRRSNFTMFQMFSEVPQHQYLGLFPVPRRGRRQRAAASSVAGVSAQGEESQWRGWDEAADHQHPQR